MRVHHVMGLTYPSSVLLQAYLIYSSSVAAGAQSGIEECKYQFAWDRWNCPERALQLSTHSSLRSGKCTALGDQLQHLWPAGGGRVHLWAGNVANGISKMLQLCFATVCLCFKVLCEGEGCPRPRIADILRFRRQRGKLVRQYKINFMKGQLRNRDTLQSGCMGLSRILKSDELSQRFLKLF